MKRRDFMKGLLALPALAALPTLALEEPQPLFGRIDGWNFVESEDLVTYNPQQEMEISGVPPDTFLPGDMMIIDDGYTVKDYRVLDWDGENKFVLEPWTIRSE